MIAQVLSNITSAVNVMDTLLAGIMLQATPLSYNGTDFASILHHLRRRSENVTSCPMNTIN
jgi:hypothetical protein